MTQSNPGGPAAGRGRYAGLWGALIGAPIGFAVGAATYLLLTPALEASTGLIRELQGLSWNLVPGLTLVGAVVGLLVGLAWRRKARRLEPPSTES